MKKLTFIIILTIISVNFIFAQEMPDILGSSNGKRNYIFITKPLPPGKGVILYRSTGKKWEQVNKLPVTPINDPMKLERIMGQDFMDLAKSFRSTDPGQIMIKLKKDPIYSTLFSLQKPKLAMLLGRLLIDKNIKTGATYSYKVAFVTSDGKEKKVTSPIRVTTAVPSLKKTHDFKVTVANRMANIRFSYPLFSWANPDPVVGFNVYRSDDGGKTYIKVNSSYLYRMDKPTVELQDGLLNYGSTYYYRISLLTFWGEEIDGSSIIKIFVKDTEPPAIISGIEARAKEDYIVINWNLSSEGDVAGYNIFRGERPEKVSLKLNEKLIPVLEPVFIDSSAVEGVQYFYGVKAVDKNGNASKMSSKPFAVIPDNVPPVAPENVKAKYVNGMVNITWQPVSDKALRGYYVYRGENKKKLPQLTPKPLEVKTLAYADSGFGEKKFKPGVTYWVAVRAVDMAWNLSDYTYCEITVPDNVPPEEPTGIFAEVRPNGDLFLSWNPSPAPDVVKYKIYMKNSNDKEFSLYKTVGKDTLELFFPRRPKGQPVSFKITALDDFDNESLKSAFKEIMIRDYSPPPHPRNVFFEKNEKGILFTWNKVVDFDLVGYRIYRSGSATGEYKAVVANIIKQEKYLFPIDMQKGYYQVRAVDSSGNESKNNEIVFIQ